MTGTKLLDHWSPPDGAGPAVACLATTYTFEADFFAEECISRFLSLSSAPGEGDRISSIVTLLEEEERLSEAQVGVLVDRSTPVEKRNLRWDVLQVHAPGGLLHAKVAVLLWERSARVILGSANLTTAGYRKQVEIALALDIHDGCELPRSLLEELVAELRRLVALAPASTAGAQVRCMGTVDLLADRVASLRLPTTQTGGLRLTLAPARPGVSPLDRLPDVWHGPKPLNATVLSPFWDDKVPAPAIVAVRKALTGQPASGRSTTLVAGIDPYSGTVNAPASLTDQPRTSACAFDPPDNEIRGLHAKLLLLESPHWLAALIGSSNATEAGYGLHGHHGHHELNLWLGCPASSGTAKQLRALARPGKRLDADDERWDPEPDEDEPTLPSLPLGFVTCTVDPRQPPRATFELDPGKLPHSWTVHHPAGDVLLRSIDWVTDGCPRTRAVDLRGAALPSYVLVEWQAEGVSLRASWTANVDDRTALPPPADLAELPVDVLLAALASTRPLPLALERALRRKQETSPGSDADELDPLRRFDGSGLLLHRVRQFSLALWRLGERLARPCSSLDTLRWRLGGVFGPTAIANGLVRAAKETNALPGESHFMLAELALTLKTVAWHHGPTVDRSEADRLVGEALEGIAEQLADLPPPHDESLARYVDEAIKEARR